MTLPMPPSNWDTLQTQLSPHPAQHEAFRRLRSMPIGARFKRKHLLSDTVRPDGKGGAVIAADAVIRKALRFDLIRIVDGVAGLIPYYEKIQ